MRDSACLPAWPSTVWTVYIVKNWGGQPWASHGLAWRQPRLSLGLNLGDDSAATEAATKEAAGQPQVTAGSVPGWHLGRSWESARLARGCSLGLSPGKPDAGLGRHVG